MNRGRWAVICVWLCLAAGARTAGAADDDATILRVFLKDGTSLVSYGEPALVENRVVFSMPTSASVDDRRLQLVNLPLAQVDWERTNRYAEAARATRYVGTQASYDYALLSENVAKALNTAANATPDQRLALLQKARAQLADWPPTHFNYKQEEVQQMLMLLDEAIAELRASSGADRFTLSLVAGATAGAAAAPPPEPLLPPPTVREAIEQTLTVAKLSDSGPERISLLTMALVGLERDAASLPEEWVWTTRVDTKAAIAAEIAIDQTYRSLSARMLKLSADRARVADVRGIQRILTDIHDRDQALGAKRPDSIASLVDEVQAQLDAARRLQLDRERWTMRVQALRAYRESIKAPADQLAQLKAALEDIKSLAGSSPDALGMIIRTSGQILKGIAAIAPPQELRAAQALMVSAAEMAGNAARIRREAAISGSITRAWDASSAAAGSLMLANRAQNEMDAAFRLPQLPQ